MRKFSFFMASFLLLTAITASSFAQEEKVVYKKQTVIDFSDVTIQGELTKPESSYVVNRKRTKFSQLIQIRSNFRPELFNSTDMF